MFDRLSVGPILRGHFRSLSRGDRPGIVADWVARGAALLALALVVPAKVLEWSLAAPEPLLAGVALLAGSLLSAFGFLATVRLRLQDRDPAGGTNTQRAKDLLDESVSHVLAATLACLVDAVILVVGMNADAPGDERLTGWPAALAIGVSAYIAVVFLMLLNRLYATYVDAAKPRAQLNGLVSGSIARQSTP